MKHFYDKIEGYFTFKNLYQNMVNEAKDGSLFVEVGVFRGQSAAFMAVCILNSKKRIKLDLVDSWKETGVQEICLHNLEPVKDLVNLIKSDSISASRLYEDESIDFVFIDADHSYESVKNDIINWLPKIKRGGVIAGHDYHYTWNGVIKAVDEVLPDATILTKEMCWMYTK